MTELKASGVNTLIIDVGDAIVYKSHPEIALKGSFDREMIQKEIEKLRGMGFQLVPKLNFSACHDVWLKDYSRMLSTPIYYQVCKDLIDEICEIFKPEYFHLGMDEETASHQKNFDFAVIRQYDLWWHDFYFFVDCVEKNGARPWIWSDYIWNHKELFLERMPRSVIQSNWYYSNRFKKDDLTESHENMLRAFDVLDAAGYDQVPTGSVWSCLENLELLTKYCKEHISKEHLLGMMQTSWERIDEGWMHVHKNAAMTLKAAKDAFEGN